ncbi:MAG: cell division protein ZapA [Cocleimonas sp.]
MNKDSIPVTVRILEKEYKISCPEGEHESLMKSAKHVDENMKKIREGGKALSADRVAVMAAVNIAHELVGSQKEPVLDASISERIDTLQHSVDKVLAAIN